MVQMKVVFATASCLLRGNIQIQEGEVWRASDPVVRAYRDLFTDDPRSVLKTSVPYDDSEDDASYADVLSREELAQHLDAERTRSAQLEAELVTYRTAVDSTDPDSKETDVSKDQDLAKAPPVEGYRTPAEAAKAHAESEEGASTEAPVDGYRTEAEAAKAAVESKEDTASAEAPVEQATRAPGEKRSTRRAR